MSLRLSHTTWDALDPYAIAEFWRQLLDWSITEADTYKPGSDECYLTSPHGYTVLFYRVPDAKTVKNRAHMDPADPRNPLLAERPSFLHCIKDDKQEDN